MKSRFTKKIGETHIKDGYEFTFFCDICGDPYKTRLISRDEIIWPGRFMLRRFALDRASREARLHFNLCRRCFRWACDKDYNMETDMCADCMMSNRRGD